jgi:hypothetical protein
VERLAVLMMKPVGVEQRLAQSSAEGSSFVSLCSPSQQRQPSFIETLTPFTACIISSVNQLLAKS